MNSNSSSYIKRLSIPPIISILIILIFITTRNSSSKIQLTPLFSILLLCYIASCIYYFFSSKWGQNHEVWGYQFFSQGLIIAVFGSILGQHFLVSWLGVTLTMVGLILMGNSFYSHISFHFQCKNATESIENSAYQPIDILSCKHSLEIFPFPALIEKDEESFPNGEMEELISLDSIESPFSAFIKKQKNSDGVITLPSGEWKVIEHSKEDMKALFLIPHMSNEKENATKTLGIYDETGLYTKEYAVIRGTQELERSYRYRRWLSGLLINYSISDSNNLIDENKHTQLFEKFSSHLIKNLRHTDLIFLIENNEILVMLPETPRDGLKTISSRIEDMASILIENDNSISHLSTCCKINLRIGSVFVSGNEKITYKDFIAALKRSIKKQNEESI